MRRSHEATTLAMMKVHEKQKMALDRLTSLLLDNCWRVNYMTWLKDAGQDKRNYKDIQRKLCTL